MMLMTFTKLTTWVFVASTLLLAAGCGHSKAEVDGLKAALEKAKAKSVRLQNKLSTTTKVLRLVGKDNKRHWWPIYHNLINEIISLKKEIGGSSKKPRWPKAMVEFWRGGGRKRCLVECLGKGKESL